MGSKSDYLEQKVLDHVFGLATFTAPSTVYVALFTAAPSDSGGGTEVSGGSYARKSVANTSAQWSRSNSTVSNVNAQQFATASADWGTVVAFGLFDAASSGNLLYWGALTQDKTVSNGDTATFGAGDLTFTED